VTLYHYTCDHGFAAIGAKGTLHPAAHLAPRAGIYWQAWFVWLTDLAVCDRAALGLSSDLIECDRSVHRYRVTDETDVTPWVTMRKGFRTLRQDLEDTPGVRLPHWYVATEPVPVTYDPR
jgi:hypothetical protein